MTQSYQRNSAAETAPLGQGLVVLEPGARKFCALNATSSLIWARLQEPASVEQLAKDIVDNYEDISEPEAFRDVESIIQDMTALGIVVPVR